MFYLQSFLGIYPLYVGVELGLGVTIINKFSGLYGILALFTGHSLSFVQWSFYLFSFFALIVYSQGLYTIHTPKLKYFSLLLCVYTLDTLTNFFYILWFGVEWYTSNIAAANSNPSPNSSPDPNLNVAEKITKRGASLQSQSASLSYEFIFTATMTLIALVARLYINLMIIAFVQKMMHHSKYIVEDENDDVDLNLKNHNICFKMWFKLEKFCYRLCKFFFE
ncbi:related to Inositol phosphorylceramide synthase regulatory subunit KEI1 [Saccharomycodes ludwigii]|uniref:Related to Inositol phosphorylceramide synthase regulatory subunit KEI1 n=1 Tax=Saccharomycodes ludwigii TaxID=36035 RepID=A0A376BBV4_9ASCO|nr:hypothetical protein SCDLUD_003214 [Saccharomycodes ludwigii]KAH3900243.1 hypothetical protein SCDLUD_003214 [Saccharomycodes ludwigii]SSD62175.1 related to Inositol phosphorylceramide synthase regulatory subunit KEI1 [Saccharomycodes ludwigii]